MEEILKADKELQQKRKETFIPQSYAPNCKAPYVSEAVHVFIKRDQEKRGSWTSSHAASYVDRGTSTFTVTGRSGRNFLAALGDVCPAPPVNDLSEAQKAANDELYLLLAGLIYA